MKRVACTLLILCAAGLHSRVRAEQPNIVLILADDLGYADIGAYGNKVNRTPNLDRLARDGLRFTDFHTNGANCSPTRAALLTGCYQQRFGIEGALGEAALGLPQAATTMAERLREAGYATGLMGKWHLGYSPDNGPLRHGFDAFVGHLHGATDYHSHVNRYGRMDWWHGDQQVREPGYNTTLITQHATRFIQEHQARPFFLFVSHSAIHFPWMTADDSPYQMEGQTYDTAIAKLGPHAKGPIQPVVRHMIEELDRSVGEIVQTLERLTLARKTLARKTLVFFTSDNGGILRMAGVPITSENRISTNAPFRGQKHGLYEGGHRVPAIAWWPGKIPAGQESAELAMTMDLMPTILDLCGANSVNTPCDGVSLSDHLLSRGILPERTVCWRAGDSNAVRWKNWKLVSIHEGPFELYDLAIDRSEKTNLAATHSDVKNELLSRLNAWEAGFRDSSIQQR